MMAAEEITTNTQNITQRPKRRWFRYSLRTFLLVITALCISLGWKVEAARQQREAVAAVRKFGGEVTYDCEYLYDPFIAKPKPHWLAEHIGVDFFQNVVAVRIFFEPDSPQEIRDLLPYLSRLSQLRSLSIINGTFKDEDLCYLAHLTDMTSLFLFRNKITGKGFKHIVCLKKLVEFGCCYNKITDQSLEPLARLPLLQEIWLADTSVTDGCIEILVRMRSLECVYLDDTRVTPEAKDRLKKMRLDVKVDPPRSTF
jgi:hypothetical protein